ncbi:ATPase family AAA domain-containing protein 2-like [Zophobas morio]
MREFRIYLRQVLNRVSKNSRFRIFLTPVSLEEHPKYLAVVDQPMDLSLIMQKINDNAYIRPYEFVEDIKLITKNALVYFKKGDSVTNRAIELQDEVASLMADLREEFVKDCERLYRIKQKLNESDQYYENCEAEINVINSNKYDDIYNNNTSDIKKTHENFSTECSTENCVVNEPMTAKVDELLDILVSRTEKLPIKKLTEVYSELKELIYKHRLEGDRHVTLQAMFSYAAELDEISHSEHVPTNICL